MLRTSSWWWRCGFCIGDLIIDFGCYVSAWQFIGSSHFLYHSSRMTCDLGPHSERSNWYPKSPSHLIGQSFQDGIPPFDRSHLSHILLITYMQVTLSFHIGIVSTISIMYIAITCFDFIKPVLVLLFHIWSALPYKGGAVEWTRDIEIPTEAQYKSTGPMFTHQPLH